MFEGKPCLGMIDSGSSLHELQAWLPEIRWVKPRPTMQLWMGIRDPWNYYLILFDCRVVDTPVGIHI